MTDDKPDWTKGVSIDVTVESPTEFWVGKSKSYEDAAFTSAESLRILDVYADLGRNAHDGYIVNDGDGDIKVKIDDPEEGWGDNHTLKKDEWIDFYMLNIERIKLTWVADCGYRVMVV